MLKLENLSVDKCKKVQGFVEIYNTGIKFPVTLINGKDNGKTILITSGVHGAEYPCIQTSIEVANEINPENVSGKIIIIHPVNTQGFEKKANAVVPDDNKNLNRVFPGDENGTLADKIAHFLTHKCQSQADFYIDLHGGDIHELATSFAYYPGIADEEVIEKSRNLAKTLNLKYIVKSGAKTGAYNSAAIRGIPSLLIERGGRGIWSREEVDDYKKDVYDILDYLDILTHKEKVTNNRDIPINIESAIYLESEYDGCWYPTVNAGDKVEKDQKIGEIRDYFGNTIKVYYAKINGVVLYMTVSLSVENGEPLIAYGSI